MTARAIYLHIIATILKIQIQLATTRSIPSLLIQKAMHGLVQVMAWIALIGKPGMSFIIKTIHKTQTVSVQMTSLPLPKTWRAHCGWVLQMDSNDSTAQPLYSHTSETISKIREA